MGSSPTESSLRHTVTGWRTAEGEIEVHDFERNVKTAHGDERYLISFRDKANGEFGKFFTNSEEMKSILESLSKMEGAFPFETVIRSEIYAGGKTKYKFT